MKNWTIGRRITLGFTAALLCTLLIGAGAYSRLRVITTHTDSLFTDSLPGINVITRVQANAREHYGLMEKMLLTRDGNLLAKIADQQKTIGEENSRLYRDYEATISTAIDRENFEAVIAARVAFNKAGDAVNALAQKGKNEEAFATFLETADPAFQRYDSALQKLVDLNRAATMVSRDQIKAAILSSTRTIVGGVAAALLLSILVGVFITRTVNATLRGATSALQAGAEQVTAAASQVSTSSQSLAEGASHQAASIEETSATLEEVSSMSKKNADHAGQAKQLARETQSAADTGVAEMTAMKLAMSEIKAASNDVSKILKSIDEIAFQTNILALNAAVEAARAGEAGQGFAVVADEVRNLAQRSAQSARETEAKISVAIEKSENGVAISARVATALDNIVERTRRMDQIVAEIATASNEQSQGVGQVNIAVGQMDKVTQSNASTAEETAAAAEELNAQSQMMHESITQLRNLVSGGSKKSARAAAPMQRRDAHALTVKPLRVPATNGSTPPKPSPASRRTVDAMDLNFAEIVAR